jgi:large subunit ribosomal protein L16
MPKRVMRRYVHRGKRRGKPVRGSKISFGEYGIQAMEAGWITSNQIESARVAITRYVRRGGKLWIKIFPHKPLSKQPAETRMGKGKKGPPEHWVAVVKPGRVLYELSGVSLEDAKGAMKRAAHKLPIKTKFVARNE